MNIVLKIAIMQQFGTNTSCSVALGIPDTLLSAFIHNRRTPTIEQRKILSDGLKVPEKELFPGARSNGDADAL